MPDKPNDPREEVLKATKELLQNKDYAIRAIHDRNLKIKTLKDIITHYDIAFKETEDRYQSLSREKKELKTEKEDIENNYATLFELYENDKKYLKQCLEEIDTYQTKLKIYETREEKSFTHKIENYAKALGGIRGAFIRLLFTPPVSKILIFVVFLILILASIVGWDELGKIFTVISKIF